MAKGFYKNNLPIFFTDKEEAAFLIKADPSIWHKRLAYIGQKALNKLPTAVKGCEFLIETEVSTDLCDVCIQAKLPIIINKVSTTPVETYLEKVHSDLCGPLNLITFSGYRYIAVFINAVTRYTEIALLKTKDDVFNEFKTLITREENLSGLKLKRFHSDNGLEYKNDVFEHFLN